MDACAVEVLRRKWRRMLLPNVFACAGAALLLAIVPGPSTAVILRQTLRSGRRAALAATLANELGALIWALTAAVGLSALVAASQAAYDGLRLVGALVLVSLGVQSLWRARRATSGDCTAETEVGAGASAAAMADEERAGVYASRPRTMSGRGHDQAQPATGLAMTQANDTATDTVSSPPGETRRAFRVGLVTTLANPKAAIFAASFLPQFVPPHAPVLATLLLLALVWVLVDLSWYGVLVWTVSQAHERFVRSGVGRRLEQITGLVLIGLGVRLAFERG